MVNGSDWFGFKKESFGLPLGSEYHVIAISVSWSKSKSVIAIYVSSFHLVVSKTSYEKKDKGQEILMKKGLVNQETDQSFSITGRNLMK